MEAVHCLWTVLEEYKPCHVVGGLVLSSSHKHVLVDARGLPSTTGLWYYCTLRLNADNHCLFFSFNHFARTSPQHSFCLLSHTVLHILTSSIQTRGNSLNIIVDTLLISQQTIDRCRHASIILLVKAVARK